MTEREKPMSEKSPLSHEVPPSLAKRLNEARTGDHPLIQSEVMRLCAFGVSDFSNVRFYEDMQLRELTFTNLHNAHLRRVRFIRCNLSNADLTGAEVEQAYFFGSDIARADFSTIRIAGNTIDSREGRMQLGLPSLLRITNNIEGGLDVCEKAELRFESLFDDNAFSLERMYGMGVVFKSAGIVVGVLKQEGESSFLATRTILDERGDVLLWKGGIYELDHAQVTKLMIMLAKKNKAPYPRLGGAWPIIDIENFVQAVDAKLSESSPDSKKESVLRMNFVRFLSDPALYPNLEKWTTELESSSNVVTF